jgi:hypothetical protein
LPEKAAMKSDVSQITMEIKLEISRFLLFLIKQKEIVFDCRDESLPMRELEPSHESLYMRPGHGDKISKADFRAIIGSD